MRWLNRLSVATAFALSTLAAAAPAHAADAAATPNPASPAYALDLRAFLEAQRWYARLIAVKPTNPDPFTREIATGFAEYMTADRFYAKAMPVFARHIAPRDAQTLGAMARKKPVPLGQQQAALNAYWAMEKTVGPELAPVWRDLIMVYVRAMNERMVAEIRRAVADLAEHRGTGYTVNLNKIGLPTLDRVAWLAVRNHVKQTNAAQAMDKHCTQGAMSVAFLPSTLMASNGLPVARGALDDCQGALETMEKSNEAAFTEFSEGLRALNLPEQYGFAKHLDAASRKYYDFNVKLGEMNRQTLQDYRNLVALVEARREHIQLENGRLLFDNRDDLAEMDRILAAIKAADKSINDFVYQTRQSGAFHDIDLRDGITAPVAQTRD